MTIERMTPKDMFLGLIIILVWGFNFVVIAWGLVGIPPLLMGGLRFALVAIIGSLVVARPAIPLRWIIAYAMTLGFGQFALLFTAMSVGMVSGVVMAEAASAGCEVAEYSPNEVKEAVAGWGGADKHEVGQMVQTLLDLPELLRPADAADAVAVALCHLARVPARRGRAMISGGAVTRGATR